MATSFQDLQNLVNSQGDQVQQAIAGQKAGYNALLDRQQQQQQGLFDQYSQAAQKQPKLPDLYNQMSEQYGLPQAQQQLQGYKDQTYRVQGLLNNLVPDIASRTQGTLTTQAMRDRMAAAEGGKLNTQLQSLGTAMQPLADVISSGSKQISTLLPLYQQQQQLDLRPLEMQINSLGDRFAREISGYNTSSQNELNGLMDKINKQWQLSSQDWQRAQALAAQEAQYANYLKQSSQYSSPTLTPQNGPTQQQVNDYGFVKNLINQVQGGNGNAASLIIAQARNGDQRSKDIMRAFYQLQNKSIPTNFRSFL